MNPLTFIPSIGRIVLFRLADGPAAGKCRPAIIVNVHTTDEAPTATPATLVDLQVFTNSNGLGQGDATAPLLWRTSVAQGLEAGQFHAPVVASHPAKE